MESVSHKDSGLPSRCIEEDVVEDCFSDVCVQRGERIIEDLDIGSDVNGSTNIDPLFLTSR